LTGKKKGIFFVLRKDVAREKVIINRDVNLRVVLRRSDFGLSNSHAAGQHKRRYEEQDRNRGFSSDYR
jgi:hypothetical protein